MKKYLIDTNTCIYYIKGKYNLKEKFEQVNPDNCFISEITLAELKFGVENSEHKEKNQKTLGNFLHGIKIVGNRFRRLDKVNTNLLTLSYS